MFNVVKSIFLLLLCVLAPAIANAQNVNVSGAVTGNGSYATLKAAFSAINGGAQNGAFINITIAGNTAETSTASLFEGTWNTLTIQPSGGMKTISGAMSPGTPLIDLNGADRVTINGLNSLTISNTTASSNTNTSTIRFIADAVNNTVTGCRIQGSSTTPVGSSGGTIFFSSGLATGNDNNVISFCDIFPYSGFPAMAINFSGTPTMDNSLNTVTNCNIYDYFSASAASAGIYIRNGSTDITISNNRFYQTASRTQTTGAFHSAILIDNLYGNNFTVNGNVIGYASPFATGVYTINGTTNSMFEAISILAGNTTATNVQGNTIAGISMSGSQNGGFNAAPFKGINVVTGLVNIGTTTGNTIGSMSSTGSITYSSGSASASSVIGISIAGTDNSFVSNNSIGGITASNSASGPANICGIRSTTSGTLTCQSNTIGGAVTNSIRTTSTSVSTILIGIENSGSGAAISSNTIRNLTSASGTAAGGYAAPVAGIVANVLNFNQTISQNTVHSINNTDSTNATVNAGIYLNSTSTANVVERNFVHSINAAGASGSITGIYANGGTTNYRNNMIRLGIDGSGNSVTKCLIRGIDEVSGSNNFYFNSVYIGGTETAGSSNTFAFNSIVTSNTRRYRDNIFFNARSNSGGTGKHYAISAGGASPLPAGLICNFNLLYVNGSGTVLGLFNLTDQPNLAAWKTATGKDTNSISYNPNFINPVGNSSAVNLHIDWMSPVESAGTAIGSVSIDYDGETRSTLTPADIGADAGNFMLPQGPAISYSLLPATGSNTVNFDNVIITDTNGVDGTSGTRPRCYYRKKTNANTFVDNTSSTNGWKYVEAAGSVSPFSFVIDHSLIFGGITPGDTIQYFVVAQDLFITPIVTINSGTFAATPSNVNLTASAFPISGTINKYKILDAIPPAISYTLLSDAELNNVNFSNVTITDSSGINVSPGTKPRCYFKKKSNTNNFLNNTSSTNGWKYAEASGSSSPFSFVMDISLIFGGVASEDSIQYFVVAQDLSSTPNVGINSGTFASTPSSVNLQASAFPIGGSISAFRIADNLDPVISYTPIPGADTGSVSFSNVIISDASGVNGNSGTRPRCYFKKQSNTNNINDNTNSTNGWKYVEAAVSTSPFNFTIDNSLIFGGVAEFDTVQYFVVAQDVSSVPNVGINSGSFASEPSSVNLPATSFPIGGNINSYTVGVVNVAGALNGNGWYVNLASAFSAINSSVQTGANINITITNNTNEPVTGALLYAGVWSKILIQPAGGLPRTISGSMNPGAALIELNGADNVMIDGLNSSGNSLTLSNTTISSVSGSNTIRFINDAGYNTVTRCTVLGSATDIILFSTKASSGNNNNSISYCDIGPAGTNLPWNGVSSNGSPNGGYNTADTIRNCNIHDYFNPDNSSSGIYLALGTTNFIIKDNKFYQTSSRVQTSDGRHCAIQLASYQGDNFQVTGNTIGFSSANGTGTYSYTGTANSSFYGIYIYAKVGTPSGIQGNTIGGISISGSMAFDCGGLIYTEGGTIEIGTVSGNLIGSMTDQGSITFVTNSINRSALTAIKGGGDDWIVKNNTIGGIIASNTGGRCQVYGIRSSIMAGTFTCMNNTIGGSMPNSIEATYGSNISVQGIVSYANYSNITGNTIRNLTSTGGTGSSETTPLLGILCYQNGSHTVSKNIIYGLSNNNTSSGSVTGIHTETPGLNTVSGNLIHSLSASSNSAIVTGILSAWNSNNVYNNMIRLGLDTEGNSMPTGCVIRGIFEHSNSQNNKFFYNSIYIGGTAASGTSNSYAFRSDVANHTRIYLNNIFYNNRTNSSGTVKHYAIALWYGDLTCNYNILYAPNTGGMFGTFVGNDMADINAWRSATGQDSNSYETDPLFINPTGSASTFDLHISNASTSPQNGDAGRSLITNAGTPVAEVATDYDDDLRSSTPDIGADEYNSGGLNLTMIVEGFYDANSNNMRLTDTVKVYFRNSSAPYSIADSSVSVVDKNTLTGSFLISNAPTGNYYIQTDHRNAIETWSNAPVSYTQGSTISYDFTTAASQAFGNNMKQMDTSPVRFAIFSGDVNHDDAIDLTDLVNIYNDASGFSSGYLTTDLTGDNFTDLSDLTIAYNNSNDFVAVIRP